MTVENLKRIRGMQETLVTLLERKLAAAGHNLSAKELHSITLAVGELDKIHTPVSKPD